MTKNESFAKWWEIWDSTDDFGYEKAFSAGWDAAIESIRAQGAVARTNMIDRRLEWTVAPRWNTSIAAVYPPHNLYLLPDDNDFSTKEGEVK